MPTRTAPEREGADEPREELGEALADAQTALRGGSDADLLAALDELAPAETSLADGLRSAGDEARLPEA
jgi:hypothetical protein